jgi:hypothetical protein
MRTCHSKWGGIECNAGKMLRAAVSDDAKDVSSDFLHWPYARRRKRAPLALKVADYIVDGLAKLAI